MPPSPGDPFLRADRESQEIPMEIDPSPLSEAEKHAKLFLQYQELDLRPDNETLRKLVLFWKSKAEALRSAGVPLHVNRRNREGLDPSLVKQAEELDEFLDNLIPQKGIHDELVAQKCRVLMSGAEDYNDFARRMKELDYSLKCNEIWENDSVAYRCNTCAMTPCMSLCAECFLSNGHEGHDFTRFFSREGGACDCGNEDVLLASGFCSRHGAAAMEVTRSEPSVAMAEYIYMKVILRIFLRLRGFEKEYDSMQVKSYTSLQRTLGAHITNSITFLQECVNLGGPMRNAMTRILTDLNLYKLLTEETSADVLREHDNNRGSFLTLINLDWRTNVDFQRDLLALLDDKLRAEFIDEMHDEIDYMRCDTLLHEFLFWIFRLKFPQNAINFILSMLSDPDYLNMVALRFFKWYPVSANIMKVLCKKMAASAGHSHVPNNEVGSIASRIIHVSVQMLSSSTLCCRMNDECDLVSTVFRSALYLLGEVISTTECFLDPGLTYVRSYNEVPTEYRYKIQSKVILADKNAVISQHGYWFVMGDIQNVMSHTQLAVKTVCSPAFKIYLKLAGLMQGMNVYWRIVSGDHAVNDNGEVAQRTFTMEYETLSITMFNFVMAILSEGDEEAAKTFFSDACQALKEWITDVVIKPMREDSLFPTGDIRSCPAYSFTIHLPLHRHVSVAISHFTGAIEEFSSCVDRLKNDGNFLRLILLHPLRIHVFRAEHHCGMWVRNGHQLRIQSMLYAQPHINQSFFQPDLDLIRFCAANVSAEWFICTIFESYHLCDFFEIEDLRENIARLMTEPMEEDEFPGRYSPDPSGTRNMVLTQERQNSLTGKKFVNAAEEALKNALESQGITYEMLKNFTGFEGNANLTNFLNMIKNVYEPVPESPPPPVEERQPDETGQSDRQLNRDEIRQKIKAVSAVLRHNNAIHKFVISLNQAHEKGERLLKNDFSRIAAAAVPGALKIGTRWNPDKNLVLRRAEWVDPMVQNCFLLLAELLVVRVNCGTSERESMRQEMVHELANGKMKYSHIRQCITDKGSRNSSNEFFSVVLEEVADYHEPDEGNDNKLSQGGYTLKPELWHSDFDPIFAQMRANLPGRGQEALMKAERYDLESLPTANRPTSLWIPYRLYETGLPRHEAVKNIFNILFTDRFTQLALLTIETKRSGINLLSDNTIQLMVYLLSIAAHEGGNRGEVEKATIYQRFHKIYSVKMHGAAEANDISLFQSIYKFFMGLAIKKSNVLEQLERVISGELYQERIIGSELEYLGRLLTILQKYDKACKFPIEVDIHCYKELKREEDSKIDRESEKKLAMKRKREAILEKQRQKGAKLMEKHRENEGLSLDEVNAMDITNRQISSYECPICGDNDIPSTLQNPLGMMGVIVSNNLPELRVKEGWNQPTLMDAIERGTNFPQQKRSWDRLQEKDLANMNVGIYIDNILGPSITAEIQTCGHTAHLECFKLFQISQVDALRQDPTRGIYLSCPLCRTSIDTIIPMRIDADFGTTDIGELDGYPEKAFEEIKKCVVDWEKNYQDPVENTNFNAHYTTWTDNWMDKMSQYNINLKAKYDCQTNLGSIMRAAIERNIIYKDLGVPERRKNGWTLPIVQLIPAAVSRTTTRNADMCLQAVRDLFVPDRIQVTRSISESSLPAAVAQPDFDIQEVLGNSYDYDPEREPERGRKIAVTTVAQKEKKIETLVKSRSDVPLLLFDFRLLFIRIGCFIVDNDKLSNHDKLALLHSLAKRIVRSGGIRTSLILLHRVNRELNNVLVQGDWFTSCEEPILPNNPSWLLKYACDWYRDNPHMWKVLQANSTEDPRNILHSLKDVFDTMRASVFSLDHYCQEFIFSTGLVQDRVEVESCLGDFSDCQEELRHWIRWFVMELTSSKVPPTYDLWNSPYPGLFGTSRQPGPSQRHLVPPIKAAQILHRVPLAWQTVTLLQPPRLYDELFSKLFKRKCNTCDKVPQTPFICMNCGELICFDDCCKIYDQRERVYTLEINRHSEECTSGTGVYLALNSAVVVLIRGRYGAVWGSIYLDAHGEEDRNLRRGKALFLSETRFQILQKDWASQSFNRVPAWYVSNMLHNLVREARL